MQTPIYFVAIFCFSICAIFAQNEVDTIPSTYHQVVTSPQDSIAKYKKLSITSHRAGDLEAFKKYSHIMLSVAKVNDLAEDQISALVYLAIYYQQIDQHEKSLSRYLEAEKLSDSLPENAYSRILVQVNLGNLYNRIEDYEKVKPSMKKVIELAAYHKNSDAIIISAYNSLGTANLKQGNYSEALNYMHIVKDLAEKMGRNDKIIGALINISECQRHLGDYDQAIENSQKALNRIDENESIELKASANFVIGISYYLSDRPAKALPKLKEARNIATEGNFLNVKMEAHEYLAKTYKALDSINNSLEEQIAYTETREKFLKTLSKAQRLKLKEDSKAKSDIISKQEDWIVFLNKEKQFYVFLGITLIVLLMASSIVYWNKRKKLTEESLRLQDDKELLKNENEALKDKLNAIAKKNQEQTTSQKNIASQQQKKSSLTLQDQEKYMNRILNYMEEEKPYLDHEIKQSDIADNLSMSVHLFSEILNACFKKNFNNFINLYRIDEAKYLMKNPKYEHYKILAIGYEAGFPSKTSFNRVFKKLVGLTPSEYQKKYAMSNL